MQIAVAAPVRPGTTSGNDVTAARWARRLTELGHEATVVPVVERRVDDIGRAGTETTSSQPFVEGFDLPDADVLVALHARRCAAVVARWRATHGTSRPVIVALAGTDLYHDLPDDPDARASLTAAARIVVLQPKAIERLATIDSVAADKAHVVYQSVDATSPPSGSTPAPTLDRDAFNVVVLAHLREVKDPLLAARAAQLVSGRSRVRVEHAGVAHDESWRLAADEEMKRNARYHWRGELSRDEASALLAQATVLACTSRLEGGANVVTEALALRVPVIGTRIDGNTGLLGDDYPGLVPVGDARALADLLERLERDPGALADLQQRVDARRHLTDPATERSAWADVIAALELPRLPLS